MANVLVIKFIILLRSERNEDKTNQAFLFQFTKNGLFTVKRGVKNNLYNQKPRHCIYRLRSILILKNTFAHIYQVNSFYLDF